MLMNRLVAKTLLCAGLCAVCWTIGGGVAFAEDADVVEALPEQRLPLPPRLALPPRQCLNCPGPCAPAPCFDTHRGYLYYGTYPWDDDPANEFNDCPGGRCGYPGAMLSLHWIRAHSGGTSPAHHHHHRRTAYQGPRPGGCVHCQAGQLQPTAASTPGAVLPTVEHQGGAY